MKYIICYDISDNKRLYRIAKALNFSGYRVQKSFFSCDLSDGEYQSLLSEILSRIDPDKDKVAIYKICEKCVSGGTFIGCTATQFFEKEYMVL